jgi:poly(3-hydroxybutyrate) depolymerase
LLLVGDLPARNASLAEVARQPVALESTFSFAGQRRAYYVFRPTRLGTAPTPLLLALHADGSDARRLERTGLLNDIAERYGLTIAYAAGRTANGAPAWDTSDTAFLAAVVDAVLAKHRIDKDRIFLAGEGSAAAVAALAACGDPGRYAGLALLDTSAAAGCADGEILRALPPSALFEPVSNRD